jgi:hypothetical protein
VTRRELLRLLTMISAYLGGMPGMRELDWERIGFFKDPASRVDAETVDQYEALNGSLWRTFGSSVWKAATAPLVHRQLAVVAAALARSHGPDLHQRLCAVVADLLQLAGELAFDANRYDDAARCYSLAATASKEAGACDLWACALTRYAYISVYEGDFAVAQPMLDAASRLAANGDGTLVHAPLGPVRSRADVGRTWAVRRMPAGA